MGRLSSTAPSPHDHVELDEALLQERVEALYTDFAGMPAEDLHFEIGSALAERLGYSTDDLASVPSDSVAVFAGVGYHLDLAELQPGERVLDVGVGSGTDTIIAAIRVGPDGAVTGIDGTPAQANRARRAASDAGLSHVRVLEGRAERLPVPDRSVDVVISNGVLNLVPDKPTALAEIARVLRPGGRVALSDIVSQRAIGPRARCNVNLWAECVAGAEPVDDYLAAVAEAGLAVVALRANPAYAFRPGRAGTAAKRWGVHSISLAAVRA